MSKAIVESCLAIAAKYPNKSGSESIIKVKQVSTYIYTYILLYT